MNSPNVNSPLGCGPNRGGPSRLDIVEFNIEYLQVQSDAFSDTWIIIVIFHFLLKSSEFYWQFGLVFESGIYIVSGADFWCPWSLLWKSFVIFTLEACSGAQNIWFGSFNKKWCMSFIRPKSSPSSIGYPCHSLTISCCWDLTDVTLPGCEDSNSKTCWFCYSCCWCCVTDEDVLAEVWTWFFSWISVEVLKLWSRFWG